MRHTAVVGWLLAGLVGAWYFWQAYPRVFPEASIDLRITPREAQQRALQSLRALQPDLDLTGWRGAVAFHWHDDAKRYLEKTLGLERANAVMRNEVSVWYFHCRWAREGERAIYWAQVAPSGDVVVAGYTLPEEAQGASLPSEKARAIAEAFLHKTLRVNLREWRLVNAYEQQRPNRRDYAFVYEHRTRKYPADSPTPATVRLRVNVAGDRVLYYSLNRLHTPEKWAFEQRQRESQRTALNTGFGVAYMGLQIAAIGVAVWMLIRRQPLGWRFALRLALVLVGVSLLAALNFAPLWWLDYDPARPEPTFLGGRLLTLLLGTLFHTGLLWFIFALTAEWLGRERPLGDMPLAKLTMARFWTTEAAVRALLVGVGFAGLHMAYVCAVYQLSFRLGAWTPLNVPYTNGVATPLPFVEPLLAGLLPAVQEELMFRGIALWLLWRILKRFWLAAFLSSLVWAFLHVGYPTEPAYLRGLELLPVGLGFCWLAARYGLLAPMAAHYTYNALLTATTYLNMDAPYLRVSALLTALGALLFLTPALATVLRRRRLRSLEEVDTPAMDIPPPPAPAEPRFAPYRPLAARHWALLAASLLGIWGWNAYHADAASRERRQALQTNRTEAIQIARDYLQRLGAPIAGYRTLAFMIEDEGDPDAEAYAESIGQKEAYEQIAKELPRGDYWQVWFFRPQERTQWFVHVDVAGAVLDHARVLPEEAVGDLPEERGKARLMLSEAKARQRAERYLTQTQGYDLAAWRLIETNRTERPSRYDYAFTYEHRTQRVGEAKRRLTVQVQGALAQDVQEWWELPERWFFERRRFQAWGVFALGWVALLALGALGYLLFWEWREGNAASVSRALAWRALLAGVVCLSALSLSQGERLLWSGYDPADPPRLQQMLALVGAGTAILIGGALVALLYMGLEPNYWRTRLGHLVPLSVWLAPSRWREAPPDSPLAHPAAAREGWRVATLLCLALGLLEFWYSDRLPPAESALPWLQSLSIAGVATLIIGALALAAVGTYRRYVRSLWRLGLLALLFAPAAAIGAESWLNLREHLQTYALVWLIGVPLCFGLGRLLQGNLIMWGWTLFGGLLLADAALYWSVPDAALRMNGAILVGVYIALSFTVLLIAKRMGAREAVVTAPEPAPAEGYAVVQMEEPHAETERS